MNKKIIKFFKRYYKLVIIFGAGLIIFCLSSYFYNNVSTMPAKRAFNKAFNYYLTGDCDNYSKSYNVSFSEKFLRDYGDTDWVGDATYGKLEEKINTCMENNNEKSVLDVKIKTISREKFSDTAFIQAEITNVNHSGVHHIYPQSFIMKKISNKWFLNTYCDTEKDSACK